ncbi:hypothetical protein [Lysinibacillus sp. K60]|uniref:DUF7305 domain-containing protein n=1 Tax=Lysinibacillus sp. K60 TaxID=2720027 RepID=UPI001C8C66A6|nr:hypothetical protein [Lysinibacillus sp. K60]MBX8943780.1 hypothetical protein [Lysinibacillus sp. K60]
MSKQIKNQRGSALALALFLVVIISILGISLLSVSSNSLKQVDYERKDQAVFYIAEAGMSLAKLEVKKELTEIQSRSYQQITKWIDTENTRRKSTRPQLPRLKKAEAEAEYRRILNSEFKAFKNAPSILESHAISTGKVASITLDTEIPADGTPLLYRINIVSKGSIDGAKEREVTQEIEIEPRLPFSEDGDSGDGTGENNNEQPSGSFPDGYASIVSGNISITEGGSVTGNVSLQNGTFTLKGGAKVNGDISLENPNNIIADHWLSYTTVPKLNIDPKSYLPPTFFPDDKFLAANNISYASKQTIGDQWNPYDVIDNQGNYNAPHTWRDPKYTLNLSTGSSSIKFRNFTVDTGNDFTIDVGDKEVDIYIDNLNIKNGKIFIKGNGKLNIYAKNISNFIGPFNQNGNPSQLNIYHQGSSTINLNANSKIAGSIINKSSNMVLTSGAAIYGNIISGGRSIEISGGMQTNGQYIIAPNATINLKGGGNITGIVVANNISSSGGTNITYGGPATPLPPGVVPETETSDYPTPNVKDNLFWTEETSMIEN